MATHSVNILMTTSQEQDNFYRLARLIIDGGTMVLRDIFNSKIPPAKLPSKLAELAVKDFIKKKANPQQKLCVYPSPGKYGKSENFDISLIALLLQNICGLAPPSKGWNEMPPNTEQTLSADVVRLRMFRNHVYGHVSKIATSDIEFKDYWDKLSNVLIRIESNMFGAAKNKEWTDAIRNLFEAPLTESDKKNVEELETWYLQDHETKEILSRVEMGLSDVQETVGQLRSDFNAQTSGAGARTCFKKQHQDLPLDYFCYDCKENSCKLCAKVDHHNHKVYHSDNDPEMVQIKKDICEEIQKAENKLVQNEDQAQLFSQKLQDAIARLAVIGEMVHGFTEKCVQEIRHQEEVLIKDIENISLKSSVEVDEIKSRISKHQVEIRRAVDCARNLLEKGDTLAICQEASAVKTTLKDESRKELVFEPLSCEKKTFAPNTSFFDDLYSNGIGSISTVDPLKCTASGPGVDSNATLYQGLETTFTVTTLSPKREVVHAPSEKISVMVSYKQGAKRPQNPLTQDVSKNITDNRNGTYTFSYIPLKVGTAFVSVKIGRESIKGSSFEVTVTPRKYVAKSLIGKKGKGNGNFDGPWCAAENSKGDIYITDRDNNRIQVFDKQSSWKQTIGGFGFDDGQLIQPRGITVNRHDDVIVVDNGNNRVQVFDKNGKFKTKFGGPGIEKGRFQNPYSVALDDDDNLIISDGDNRRVQIFNAQGEFVRSFGENVIKKSFYCIYHDEKYIVSDFEGYCVRFFNGQGQYLHSIGKRGARDGEFDKWIRGLAVDKVGNLLVCDAYADRIQIFRPVGTSFEFLAKFGKEGDKLGKFKQPTTITVLKNGRFVVCEFYNSRVQIF